MAPSSLAAVAAQAPNTSPCSPHTSAARPDNRPITRTFNAAERMLACPSQASEMARAVHASNDGSDLYLRTLISFELGACRCGADVSQFPFPPEWRQCKMAPWAPDVPHGLPGRSAASHWHWRWPELRSTPSVIRRQVT